MPRLVRLYISQSLLGFGIAAVFIAGLLWFDVGRLWYLATHADTGPFAVLLLWAHMGFIFAGVQFAIAVMRMAEPPGGGGGPGSLAPPRLIRVEAHTRVPRSGRKSRFTGQLGGRS